ncbi:fatty acyl-CoA synthetase [Conexibacter arvalis]|uniref:Fatty-acyl-CoA synthase n=1 Tax=Conexibacter arvalis TaxID=912552 RepID=A0A840ID68_9ACTN|nr:fatty acyl-CoA synthetase [Conexibacter arvalis]MBB4662014.1 fatty-acyl-CoA synthase [Conexibacter arvalis]
MPTATPRTVDEVLRISAQRDPDRTALRFRERRWSYRELDLAVDRVAARLRERGLRPGDRVAAFGRNSDAYLVLFLACSRAGLVHVPVNYNARAAEVGHMLSQSGSGALFADPSCLAAAGLDGGGGRGPGAGPGPGVRGTLREGAGDDVLAWAASGPVEPLRSAAEPDGLAQLLYTSGTTSAPKGAMLSHRALLDEYATCVDTLDLARDDVPLHALPLYHSAQMHVFLLPYLAVGATNHLVDGADAGDLLRRVEADGATSFFAPPTVWIDIERHPDFARRDLSTLRKAYYGAAAMPVAVLARLRETLPRVGFYNIFGQTEAGPLTAVLRPEEHRERPASVGLPVPRVQLRVVDAQMNDVAAGERGEVVYRSSQLCSGYWRMPDETEAAFAGGWFHSGDLAYRDEEGYLYVVDRIKDVINSGGVLIASREVEEALYSHPAVAEAAVIATPHPRWVEAVTAVVVARGEASAHELIEHVRARLSPQKAPKAVHFVERLPRNPSGKVLKRELRERFGGVASAVACAQRV